MSDSCAACQKTGATKFCAACKEVFYCDKDCQAVHWKSSHKGNCSKSCVLSKPEKVAVSSEARGAGGRGASSGGASSGGASSGGAGARAPGFSLESLFSGISFADAPPNVSGPLSLPVSWVVNTATMQEGKLVIKPKTFTGKRPYYKDNSCFWNALVNSQGCYKELGLSIKMGSQAFNGWWEFGNPPQKGFGGSTDAHAWLEDAAGNVYDYIYKNDDYVARVRTQRGLPKGFDILCEALPKSAMNELGISYKEDGSPEIRAQITKEWTKWDAYFLKQVREKYPGMFLG
jgi:hypothetical protein